MIREFNQFDLEYIDSIGNQIKDDFVKKYVENINLNVENIYVYEQDNKVIGFIHISNSFNDIDIINIAVDKDYQHKGIASKLIGYIKNELKPNKIMLEVRESNINAINLYKKCGFEIIHTRKNYYGNESALVMEVIL